MMHFYVLKLEIGSSHDTTFNAMEPKNIGKHDDCRKCPACGDTVTNLPWLPPFRAEVVAHKRQLGDVAFFGTDILVSEKFRRAWTDAQLQGIETFHQLERLRVRPARLGRQTVTYYYVDVHHFGTRVDLKRSLVEYAKPFNCTTCHDGVGTETVRGFKIDETSWTGEDIFEAWGMPGVLIVTDRVRQLRDEYGLTNVTLTPTEAHVWDPLYRWTPIDYSPDEPIPNDDAASLN